MLRHGPPRGSLMDMGVRTCNASIGLLLRTLWGAGGAPSFSLDDGGACAASAAPRPILGYDTHRWGTSAAERVAHEVDAFYGIEFTR